MRGYVQKTTSQEKIYYTNRKYGGIFARMATYITVTYGAGGVPRRAYGLAS